MNTNKVAVVYTRISSSEQNMDSQEFSCMEYANQGGFNVVKTFKETASARYGIDNLRLLNSLITSYSDFTLIVYSIDRLSRNVGDSEYLFNTFRANNINVVSVSDQFDVLTNKAAFFNRIELAQHESDLISQRVKRSIDFRRAKGDYIGGVPYGKKLINIVLKKDRNVVQSETLYNQQNLGDNAGEIISGYINENEEQDETDRMITYNPETEYIRKVLFSDLYESAIIKFINVCCNKKLSINELNYRFFILNESLDLNWDIDTDKLKFFDVNYVDDDSDYSPRFDSNRENYRFQTLNGNSKKSVLKQTKKIVVKPSHLAEILNWYGIYKRGNVWTESMILSCI